jgi:putative exporter of polyketide antibiotics
MIAQYEVAFTVTFFEIVWLLISIAGTMSVIKLNASDVASFCPTNLP